ncbi:hypothetical protein SVIOM74S_04503 [Streptomyces violarus]
MEMDLADGDDTASFDNATDQIYYFNTIELGDGADRWTGATGQAGRRQLRAGRRG